ncbi:hypothetical protein GCM10010123_19690 [Pilimelia anulata]|uniref:Uncharacterized protein n=1 Tax=Pilimelia anulata TaxID=53371 RepID=A0A8J3B958_9ACTN|nr:hypothetical protein [Pilimelia anulata]GGJ89922.1 hypothetical protein GCM10010123_19690 [Pilimelia anulata]
MKPVTPPVLPLRIGERGIFAGRWAWQPDPATGGRRVAVGFAGTLIDWWKGWAVWSCPRPVAEAVVADQMCLRIDARDRLARTGLTGGALDLAVDRQLPQMQWHDDTLVVNETAQRGAFTLRHISPDRLGRYVIGGWQWPWTAMSPQACDRIADVGPDGAGR